MRKFQFFIVIEAVLLVMALFTILSTDLSRFVLISALMLLALRFYNQDSRSNFLLTASLILLFMFSMINPYIIASTVLAVVYIIINHFSKVKKKNRHALLRFREESLKARPIRNQWIGSEEHVGDFYAFDDINVIRLVGTDTIDLTGVIVSGENNVIIVRKMLGPTKLLVPIDVAVKIDVSTIYGSVRYFDFEEYDLRNERIKIWRREDETSLKSVKIIINTLVGDVEVSRK